MEHIIFEVKCLIELGASDPVYKEFKVTTDASFGQVGADIELHPERYELCTEAEAPDAFVTITSMVLDTMGEASNFLVLEADIIEDDDEEGSDSDSDFVKNIH